jgi:hypothetical protein
MTHSDCRSVAVLKWGHEGWRRGAIEESDMLQVLKELLWSSFQVWSPVIVQAESRVGIQSYFSLFFDVAAD